MMKMSEKQREDIHRDFWTLGYDRRRDYIVHNVTVDEKKTQTSKSSKSRREMTYTWRLGEHVVCKTFFLHTIGYLGGKVVVSALSSANVDSGVVVGARGDARGAHEPSNKFSEQYKGSVVNHIEGFRPQVSHYRREHAPNRRYLPSHMTITDMHKLFNDEQEEKDKCSLTYYFGIFKALNISFAMPENDLCDRCMKHATKHPEEGPYHNCSNCECSPCDNFIRHKENYVEARTALHEDTRRMEEDPCTIGVFTVDMQKALLMPKMPNKDYYFSRKLVLFNETFAKPGKVDTSSTTVLWHEGEAGRKAHNIASSYFAFLQSNRDLDNVILYTDNCSSQNKNWILFSALPRIVNSYSLNIQTITIKYLEAGHTFMAADSVHAAITRKMAKHSTLLDLQDYTEVIQSSRKGITTLSLDHNDMVMFENETRKTNLRLKDVKSVQFRKGSLSLFYKTSHKTQEEYQELKHLKATKSREIQKMIDDGQDSVEAIPRMERPRGVSVCKKAALIKLTQMMPRYKARFFERLVVDDAAADLETVEEY